jgi:TRAP-type mannitol/chloroaromatic compound transport system permease small subunit
VAASFRVREGSPDPGGLPRYPIKALILVSFVLLLLQASSQILKQIDVIRGVADDSAPDEAGSVPDAESGPNDDSAVHS